MFKWLATNLIDSGWIKTGLFFRRIIGTDNLMYALSNEKNLTTIKRRYQLMEQSGFFSGQKGVSHQQAFIKSLFAYDAYKTDAYSKALEHFYSWNGGDLNPLKDLLSFIRTTFFQGSHASKLKQTFIKAIFAQNHGESNTLAHTAWVEAKSTKVEENPLALLLATLDEAGCFRGPKAEKNQNRFLSAIAKPNKNGENALCQSAQYINFDRKFISLAEKVPNFYLLLEKIQSTFCLEQGVYAQKNKELLSKGLLYRGELRSVLSKVMQVPEAVDYIFKTIESTGYFSTPKNRQDFFDALVSVDRLNSNILQDASYNAESLQMVCKQLKALGCFEGHKAVSNKEKLIKALIRPDSEGENALFKARDTKVRDLQLQLLKEAGCFKNGRYQQEFIDAIFAKNKYGINCLYNEPKLIETLKTLQFLKGPNAEKNKAYFITAIITKNTLNGESVLYHNRNDLSFLIEHLTIAGCFSGPNSDLYKQLFIDAVLSEDNYGHNMLSSIYSPKDIILLLQKLTEAGCLNSDINKRAFINAVKNNGNALVFRCIENPKTYIALRKVLSAAGLNAQDLKEILNLEVNDKYRIRGEVSPFMAAIRHRDAVVIELLKKDGGELTQEQAQIIEQYQKKLAADLRQKPKIDKEATTKSLQSFQKQLEQPKKLCNKDRNFKPRLERRMSFSELTSGRTLFDKTSKEARRIKDDCVLIEKSSQSFN
ncbi:hypothetical protein [Legionella gresilensis]|uniref:hypothetical protein n=1 Tax=Legionella gresilensis TaxID=91823 RepID=UPI001041868D|nr:hypothetical protein [Legionella gresilensis]